MSKFKVGDKVKRTDGIEAVIHAVVEDGYILEYSDCTGTCIWYDDELILIERSPEPADKQPAYTFKVGDIVKVVKKVEEEEGWDNTWESLMNGYINKEFKITEVHKSNGIKLNFNTYRYYFFPPSSLELIQEADKRNPLGFIIGRSYPTRDGRTFNFGGYETNENYSSKGYVLLFNGFRYTKEGNFWNNKQEHECDIISTIPVSKELKGETVMSPTKPTEFKDLIELFAYLSEGKEVVNDELRYKLSKDKKTILVCNTINKTPYLWSHYDISIFRAQPSEPKWYEKEFKPILCWVSDCGSKWNDDTAIILSYNKDDTFGTPFYTINNSYSWAQPLTKEELLTYCLGEK